MINFLNKISRTKPLSPSKIFLLNQCKLSYLLSTEKIGNKIPASPHSFFGTAIHKSIEYFLSNVGDFNVDVKALFRKNLLNALSNSSKSSPVLNWVINKVGVDKIFDQSRFISAIQQIKKTTNKYSLNTNFDSRFDNLKGVLGKNMLGSEKSFEFQEYELAGNIDFCYLDSDGLIHVIDFKSGNIFNQEGSLKEDYYTQIVLYGLMVRRHYPNNKIQLEVLGATNSWVVNLHSVESDCVLKNVKSATDNLPYGVEFPLEILANLGDHCSRCRVRSYCPKYFDVLKGDVIDLDKRILSKEDLYGEVIDIYPANSLLELRLRSTNGVILSISGLPESVFNEIFVGSKMAGYSLKYYDHEALCSFPANFYVYRPDIPKISAFEAVLLM